MRPSPDAMTTAAGRASVPGMSCGERVFADRRQAGETLARKLSRGALGSPLKVLALPRGGVPVAAPVAAALGAPLDVMVVRKVGLPEQVELAMGAVAPGGVTVRDRLAAQDAGRARDFERLAAAQREELIRREHRYRAGLPPLAMSGWHILLVDDGLATGSTMLAAVRAARAGGAASVTVAAPVASREALALLRPQADAIVVLESPPALCSIGEWYQDFDQVGDAEVCRLLAAARAPDPAHRS